MSTIAACEAPKLISPSIAIEDLNTIVKRLYEISAKEFLFRAEEIPDSNGERISVGSEHRSNVGVEYKVYSYSRISKTLTLIEQLPIEADKRNAGNKSGGSGIGFNLMRGDIIFSAGTIPALDYSGAPTDPSAEGGKSIPLPSGRPAEAVKTPESPKTPRLNRLCLPTVENRQSTIADELGLFLNLIDPKK